MRQFDFATPLLQSANATVADNNPAPVPNAFRHEKRNRRNTLQLIAPRRPQWAMFGLALLSFGGGLCLAFYCLSGLEHHPQPNPTSDAAVYQARAVPAEAQEPDGAPAPRAPQENRTSHSSARDAREDHSDQLNARAERSASAAKETSVPLYSFPEFGGGAGASGYGLATTAAGVASAESNAPVAPLDGSLTTVPEPVAWSIASIGVPLAAVLRRRATASRRIFSRRA